MVTIRIPTVANTFKDLLKVKFDDEIPSDLIIIVALEDIRDSDECISPLGWLIRGFDYVKSEFDIRYAVLNLLAQRKVCDKSNIVNICRLSESQILKMVLEIDPTFKP